VTDYKHGIPYWLGLTRCCQLNKIAHSWSSLFE